MGNLATACNPCNKIKSDLGLKEIGWELHPPPDEEWDGLKRYYALLWAHVEPELRQIAKRLGWTDEGRAKEIRYHQEWLRLLAA